MEWNQSQKQAISHGRGPMLVVAGPGSGKTAVVTARIRFLIEQYHVPPDHILVITFTRAAAVEMKERFLKQSKSSGQVMFGTFHSVFFQMLRYSFGANAATILPEGQKIQMIKEVLADMPEKELEASGELIRSLISEISMVKGQLLKLDQYYSRSCGEEVFRDIFRQYQKKLRANHLMDFDDILVFTYGLLKKREDIRSMWQEKFQYILIDEFQDINRIQYEIMKMLAGDRKNLFAVGDDDQSIYRFRGARPEIMKSFMEDFKDARQIFLSVNYRSSRDIVDYATQVIAGNEQRFPKSISSSQGYDKPVDVRTFSSQAEENGWILNRICHLQKKGQPLEDLAVLYRTNTVPRLLAGSFVEKNIPFHMKDRIPNMFHHWVAENMIDYLKAADGDCSRSTFLKIMNRPTRYIGREYLEGSSSVSFDLLKEKTKNKPWLLDYIENFEEDLRIISEMPPWMAITYIRKSVGYNAFLDQYARERQMEKEELFELLNEVQESAKGYDSHKQWFDYINRYTKELEEQAKKHREDQSGVLFSTLHSAKGLEFQEVFLIDVNEGILPHKKSIKKEDIEEERRMFYVGLTRAKTYLHVFSSEKLYHKDSKPSRFLPILGDTQKKQEE